MNVPVRNDGNFSFFSSHLHCIFEARVLTAESFCSHIHSMCMFSPLSQRKEDKNNERMIMIEMRCDAIRFTI